MKVLSRDFTRTEKILIAVLALILLALVYYQFVDKSVRQAITNADSEAQMLQTQLDAVQVKLAAAQQIKNNMDKLETEGNLSWMGSYNNSKEEVAFLNGILGATMKYSISFAEVTRNGDQIRRSFTLEYQTPDYLSAQDIIVKLRESRNRCLVDDVKCTVDKDGYVTVKQTATFYETMVDGIPDAALPQDSARANS